MYITNNNNWYSCTGYYPSENSVQFTGVDDLTLPITGTISLVSEDDDLVLAVNDCVNFARQTYTEGVLTLTNEADAAAPTIEELRVTALTRIDGKCSEAIYSGVTVNGKHYSLTLTAQSNLKTELDKVKAGETAIPYSADGEELTVYTADAITAIAKSADDWGTVNIAYYGKLKKWIARETDSAVMQGIHYGSSLPSDLMTELSATLVEFGINLSDYTNMLLTLGG